MPFQDSMTSLDAIVAAVWKIERYTAGMTYERFLCAPLVVDAVLYNLWTVSAAARQIPPAIQATYPDIRWQVLSDFREADIENYDDVDLEAVWAMVQDGLPPSDRLRAIRERERRVSHEAG